MYQTVREYFVLNNLYFLQWLGWETFLRLSEIMSLIYGIYWRFFEFVRSNELIPPVPHVYSHHYLLYVFIINIFKTNKFTFVCNHKDENAVVIILMLKSLMYSPLYYTYIQNMVIQFRLQQVSNKFINSFNLFKACFQIY